MNTANYKFDKGSMQKLSLSERASDFNCTNHTKLWMAMANNFFDELKRPTFLNFCFKVNEEI